MGNRVTMPRWPAYILFLGAAACAYPAMTARSPAVAQGPYTARGQEPGWTLTIAGGHIDYLGNYGETRIVVPVPAPRAAANGHRYEAGRLVVDVTHSRCNDAMSGHGYADTAIVIADGETYRGCGGERRPQFDT